MSVNLMRASVRPAASATMPRRCDNYRRIGASQVCNYRDYTSDWRACSAREHHLPGHLPGVATPVLIEALVRPLG